MAKNYKDPKTLKLQQIFLLKIDGLLDNKEMTRADLCRALDIKEGTLSRWYAGTLKINFYQMMRIAEYFGKTIDEIYEYKTSTELLNEGSQ